MEMEERNDGELSRYVREQDIYSNIGILVS